MNFTKYLCMMLLLAFVACSDEPEGEVAPTELIRSIQVSPQSDNVLRMDVNIEFKQGVNYQIEYWKNDDETSKKTTVLAESDGSATSTLVLLEPETQYTFKVQASTGSASTVSDEYKFTTASLPAGVPVYSMPINKLEESLPGYILLMKTDRPGYITMVDTEGNVVWYQNMEKAVRVANFDEKTNTICCIIGAYAEKDYTGNEMVVMDLTGKKLLDKVFDKFYAHHDIRRMPDGNLILVNYTPKTFDLTERGGSKEETVWGDGYTIFDMEGNKLEEWDCFGELHPADDPNIMEMVPVTSVLENPIWYKDDWLHANSVNFDSEGNIYMSFNWRSELWKIERSTGKVLYRVGKDGNVDMPEMGYANGMHCVEPLKPDEVLVFDNGISSHLSRALIYAVDEKSRKADVTMEVTLTEYSSSYMSNVQILKENLLMFGSTQTSTVVFTDKKGTVLRTILGLHQSYRSVYIPKIEY